MTKFNTLNLTVSQTKSKFIFEQTGELGKFDTEHIPDVFPLHYFTL
jgi:hypothetical protein